MTKFRPQLHQLEVREVRVQGDNLVIRGTEKNNLKDILFQATKDPQGFRTPSIMNLKQEGIVSTDTITPTWKVREVNP